MKKTFLGLISLLSIAGFGLQSCGPTQFDNSKLIIGMECNYAPFNWTENTSNDFTLPISNKSNQYADGYDIQIAKLLGESLNVEVVIVKTAWESLVTDLQMGTINAVIAGMTDTPERRESISFTNEYYRSELVLVSKKDIADDYVDALTSEQFANLVNGKIIVSQTSTVTNDVIDIFASEYGAIHANPVDTFANAATDVSNGLAFAMTAELPVAQAIVAANADLGIIHIDQEILGEKQSKLGVSIGVNKQNDELIDRLNEGLSQIDETTRINLMSEAVIRSASY